ncbi:MAG: LysM peptidoglycan-binding domain-containing protein [Mariprofundaceae bacterium]|nr:LysM peptidoglycan-binding domain-containing protein [Mariprofundaceae bacterium]
MSDLGDYMKLQYSLAIFLTWLLCILPVLILTQAPLPASADELTLPGQVAASDIRLNLPQPYIVKKGDTLWDIANYFFRKPKEWLKIWERNLYIRNPDLIYPGNKIWFNAKKKKTGGLTTVRLQPSVRIKPVERLEASIDPSLLITALKRQDFISPEAAQGVGYVLDSPDERINYGVNDKVYLKFKSPADEGAVFDVFRTGDPIHDPKTGKVIGLLVNHLGQIEVTSQSYGVAKGRVIHSFEEISRGDRLKPARNINTRIVPDYPAYAVNGQVLYIRGDAVEAGQHQIVGISLGVKDGMKAGTVLSVYKAGRIISDEISGKAVVLPRERIGELMVLVPQRDASIALITESTDPINLGDSIRNQARR